MLSENPGFVRTKSIEEMQLSDESARKFEAFLASKSALRRSANANDVAKAIVFLASDDTCSWATGTLLIVDGGMRFGQV
ncbi:3-ketoacyl-(acyl-carrier-protein) reductase-like protein [Dinothrombium tinctorium]|uniref:3-ketoacyl-(Acyl-carrier-protein) reductase-like protein n=1 Tax=Dinothrombium tinctorium TaxID=1965070 RepID=A0A443QZ62_9ACAR|nr:3-ketoacyl-(acyl-carrier-protein) reductase-like protein [Dinothrombium tinctorium]